jgi:hypothetical protein
MRPIADRHHRLLCIINDSGFITTAISSIKNSKSRKTAVFSIGLSRIKRIKHAPHRKVRFCLRRKSSRVRPATYPCRCNGLLMHSDKDRIKVDNMQNRFPKLKSKNRPNFIRTKYDPNTTET